MLRRMPRRAAKRPRLRTGDLYVTLQINIINSESLLTFTPTTTRNITYFTIRPLINKLNASI